MMAKQRPLRTMSSVIGSWLLSLLETIRFNGPVAKALEVACLR
jgi:hypothetical protein